MSTLSNMEAVLLGLLTEKPMHPYEIEKNVVDRDMRGWTEISMSSIYKVLGKLEKKLLVDVKIEQATTGIQRKVYTITDRGRMEVKEKVQELVSEIPVIIYPVELGLHNLHLLSGAESEEALSSYIRSIDRQLDCFTGLETYLKNDTSCPFYRIALAIRRQYILRAEREWARSFLSEVKNAHH
ncbi:PadR family transcriptional regulator [Methanoregula sp.]|uniref:PadR family transcriptional regulator n=1 Tax=Methanoregula sp. TaxID=2052170 RepID=UPI003561F5BE